MSCWVSLFRTQNVKCQGASQARYLPQKNLVSQTYLQIITSSGRNQRDILLRTFKYLSLIYQLILILGTCFPPGFLQKTISDLLNVHLHEFCSLAFQIPILFVRESVINFLIISWSRHRIPPPTAEQIPMECWRWKCVVHGGCFWHSSEGSGFYYSTIL